MGLTRNQVVIVAILLAGATLVVLNQTLLSPAYPSIMADLQADATTVQWLTSAYSLVEAIVIPLSAFLIGRFPTRKLFIAGVSVFALGSLMAAFSPFFGILLLGCYIASLGLNPLKKLLTAAGTCTFIMSLLYIVMMFAAPAINPTAEYVHANLSFSSLIPNFNVTYFTSLSILVFAVGGCEKISPYVNKVENPSKGFPKGMIALAGMVVVCAVLGTLAMSRMFDPAIINESTASFNAYAANSSYWAFQKLGQYYHVGDLFMIIYALCNVISQFAVLILSIDAPLRMLLDNEHTQQFIPQGLHKVNAHGVHSNGIKMVAVLSGSIILVQSFVPGAAAVLRQLTKLNSVCMPMRYLWVFVAYVALRNAYDTIPAEYRFVKNQKVAKFFGVWCFAVTAICCVMGMYDKDPFTFALNVITPVVLTVLGFILPAIAKREQQK